MAMVLGRNDGEVGRQTAHSDAAVAGLAQLKAWFEANTGAMAPITK